MVPFFGGIIFSTDRKVLVPLSERRHRLHKHEIPEVVAALKHYLERHVETRENVEEAETAFRTLYRLTRDKPGRPKYPEFSREYILYYLDFHENENLRSA